MSGPLQLRVNLVWQELLTAEEIAAWSKSHKMPSKLRKVGGKSLAGVYRFIFPKVKDGTSSHTPCYVGEAGHLGDRLRAHICPNRPQLRRLAEGSDNLPRVLLTRGAIQNSLGQCTLQRLTIVGSVKLCGVLLNQNSFDDPFARRLLENWAILHSEQIDDLHALNHGIHQGSKDFRHMAKGASKKARHSI